GVAKAPEAPNVERVRKCRECGDPLPPGKAVVCPGACHDQHTREVSLPKFNAAGPAKLAQLRAEGVNPSGTPEALDKLSRTQRDRAAARAAWDRARDGLPTDPNIFHRDILPTLRHLPLSALMAATGL